MKARIAIYLLMLIAVPLAGEMKFYPFQDSFRVSLGTPVFFFFLLWIRYGPPVLSGFLTGASVVAFRVVWDHWFQADVSSYHELLALHYPVFFYYLAYGLLFQLLKLHHAPYRPVRVGALSVLVEFAASLAELSFRHTLVHDLASGSVPGKIIFIAVIRSFFVLGFFNLIQLRQAIASEEQQRRENERITLLVSDLFEESVLLKKTLGHAEDITRDCYELYRSLLENGSLQNQEEPAQQALRIAGQIHEIKKDNQRIYAGLSRMIADQSPSDYIHPVELVRLVVRSNEKYAAALGKDIRFIAEADQTLPPFHVYTVLTLLNNLAANSVEAIPAKGTVRLYAGYSEGEETEESVEFRVSDDGPGIPPRNRARIFTPGYTSKYDSSGKPSTGMGLCYIKEVVEGLEGQIDLLEHPEAGETVFRIRLPIRQLIAKG